VTARGIKLAVRRVLADPSYARRAGRLRAWAELHDGSAQAAAAVEELRRPAT
jgi:UDP:flavonoid glycosyltransferase YjiC (YdhE family)